MNRDMEREVEKVKVKKKQKRDFKSINVRLNFVGMKSKLYKSSYYKLRNFLTIELHEVHE